MTHSNIGIDSRLSDNFGRSVIFALSFFVTVVSVTLAGGFPFLIAIVLLGFIYFDGLQLLLMNYFNADHDTLSSVAKVFHFLS